MSSPLHHIDEAEKILAKIPAGAAHVAISAAAARANAHAQIAQAIMSLDWQRSLAGIRDKAAEEIDGREDRPFGPQAGDSTPGGSPL